MILVIGDEIIDRYEEFATVRVADGDVPVVQKTCQWQQRGGALAVHDMVLALGAKCGIRGNSSIKLPRSEKTRTVIDGRVIFRRDNDCKIRFADDLVRIIEREYDEPSVVLVADYGKGAIDRSVILACLKRGWRVVADPHITTEPSVFDGIYGITPNRAEDQRHRYWLREGRIERCCLTLDHDGMSVRDPSGRPTHLASTAEQPPLDVCGAGDQVLATIGVMLSSGHDWHEACRVANIAAGIKCDKRGTTPVTWKELQKAIRILPVC